MRGAPEVAVWLSTGLIDLDQKIEVIVNGKPLFKGHLKPRPGRALELARKRGDSGAVFSTMLVLKVPK